MHVKACKRHPCLASAASFIALRKGTAMPSMHCSLPGWLSTPPHNQRLSERVIRKTFQSYVWNQARSAALSAAAANPSFFNSLHSQQHPSEPPEKSLPEISEGTDVRTPYAAQQPQPSSAEAWHHIWLVWPAQAHRWLLRLPLQRPARDQIMCPDLRCFLVRGFWTPPAAMSPGAAAAASLSAAEAPAAAAAAPSAARLRFLSSFSTATPGSFCFVCLPSAFCLAFSAALAPASVAACGCLAGAACRGSAGGISSSSSWLSAPAAASACTAEEKVKQA